MLRVETRTGDDCVSKQRCEQILKPVETQNCFEIPREVCSNSGCKEVTETKCETSWETVYEESCGLVHECPVCPVLRDSYRPTSEKSYTAPTENPYAAPSAPSAPK